VGIELNPGPKTAKTEGKKKKKVSKSRSLVKAAARLVLRPKAESASLGKRVGGWVGDMAQKAILAITGFGDYQVRSNTLTNGGSPPQFSMGKHMTKICHREFVGLVTSPGAAFTTTNYFINPTTNLFPWLSEIALSFEQFAVRGMVVEFKSTSATAVSSTNTALGSVILATQYNVLAPAFTSQQQMEAYEFCTSCNPSQSMIHPIECAPNLTTVSELYVDQFSTGDPRLQNLGVTTVATVGQQAASTLGELWVSYEIDLIRPKLFLGVANLGLSSHWVSAGSLGDTVNSLATAPMKHFTNANLTPGSDLPATLGPISGITFPVGFSGFVYIVYNAIISGNGAAFSDNVNCSPVVLSGNGQVRGALFNGIGSVSRFTAPSTTSAGTGSGQWTNQCFLFIPGNSSVPCVFTWTPFNGITDTTDTWVASEVWMTTVSISG
jgi:hypothetical protein